MYLLRIRGGGLTLPPGLCRYLLRIETSNPDLYATLHPGEMSWENRVKCLRELREVRG